MAQYSFSQLQQIWTQYGCDPSLAPTMAAIAMAESGGNSEAVGDDYPIDGVLAPSYGLWQIRSVHADSIPNFFPPSNEWATPQQNAGAACSILGSQGLSAWSTWQSYVNGDGGHGDTVISGLLGPFTGSQPSTSSNGWLGGVEQGLENIGSSIVSGAENIAAGIFQDAEDFGQWLFGGWVSPFLRLPQSLINIGWNFGGFCIGLFLIVIGGLLLFGGMFEGIADDISAKIEDGNKNRDKINQQIANAIAKGQNQRAAYIAKEGTTPEAGLGAMPEGAEAAAIAV